MNRTRMWLCALSFLLDEVDFGAYAENRPLPRMGEGEKIGNLGVLGSEAAQNAQISEFSWN
jgi:hypothetical protein